MNKEKELLDKMIDTYGDITLTEAEDGSWRNRKKSYLVKRMLSERKELRRKDLGDYLGCPVGTMDYKFNRDSFTFDDLVAIAYACDYDIVFRDRIGKRHIMINALEWFQNYNDEESERLKKLKSQSPQIIKKRSEYELKKKELEALKAEYGFED